MIRVSSRLVRQSIDKLRSEGLIPLLRVAKLRASRRVRETRVVRGKRQFTLYTALRYRIHQLRYTAPADPYKRIQVAPTAIQHRTLDLKPAWGLGQVKGGDWDRDENLNPIEGGATYQGLKQRFEEGCEWEETVYYERAQRRFETQGSNAGYDDLEQYRRVRCAFVDELFETIRTEGYRSNFDATHDVPESDSRKTTFAQHLEPLVAIGRDGEVYLSGGGYHRRVIAELLDVESIPVNVVGRHRQWQQIRDTVERARTLSELPPAIRPHLSHPDLEDVTGPLEFQ